MSFQEEDIINEPRWWKCQDILVAEMLVQKRDLTDALSTFCCWKMSIFEVY